MGLATVALVLAAGLAACLVCCPPMAQAGPLSSEERGLSAPLSEGAVGGGQLTDPNAGPAGPESGEKRRLGRKNRKNRAGKGGKRGGAAGKRGKCKTPECKRERREKRKLRRKQKQERRRNNKKNGGGGGGGKKNRGGKNKRRGEPGEDASASDALDRRMA